MFTNRSAHIRKFFLGFMLVGIMLFLLSAGSGSPTAHAQDVGTPQTTEQPTVRTVPLSDEPLIEEHVINGPSVPPPGFEAERQPVELFASSAIMIENVPTYTWSLGCSAGGGGIVAAYNDKLHPNIIEGEMPLDDSSMTTVTDINGDTYRLNPAVASQATFTDYWIEYGSPLPDPYTGCGPGCSVPAPRPIGGDLSSQSAGWLQHAWGDTLGDFMYTSQSAFGNVDGSTKFYTYENSASPFTWEEMSSNSKPDGTLGIKLFYETRGYAVGESYNQLTSNVVTGGFSLAQYKAEINAGRPVILHLGSQPNEPGHTVVGVGYDTASNTIYIHDGWDYATHTMTWGGSYSGMPLQMVSIVNIVPGTPITYTISGNVGIANATIAYTGGYTTSDANGNYSFTVVSGWFGTVTPSKTGITFIPADRFYANMESNVVAQNYNDVNLLQDPSFEDGTSTNDYWIGTSTNFGTPLCDVNCIGEVLARTGSIWAWFGGVDVNETATLSQTITIPNTSSASLDFYLWIPDARAGSDIADAFTVIVDGTTVFTANATQVKYYSVYRPININISPYADGTQHEIEFSAVTSGQVVSFLLDDVSLTTTSNSSPPAAFNKASPSNGATGQSTSPTLSWNSSSAAASYEYCYDTTNDNACSNWTSNGSSTSKALSGLNAGTTYYWHVRAVSGGGTTYANGSSTAYWSFTTAASSPVQASDAWTADGAWNLKTSFNPGDPIQWVIEVENNTGSDAQVELKYTVKDPTNVSTVLWQDTVTTGSGVLSWGLPGTVPSVGGTYSFTGSVTYQGVKAEKTVTYTVIGPTQTFSDVPTDHPFYRYIEAFYNSGITVGCSQSPRMYCLDNRVTRGEMAVFIERALGNFAPAPSPTGMFSDLPYPGLESFTPFIEEYYNDGITVGCLQSPLTYCPQNYVTRGEMAVFIERAIGNFSPSPSPTGMFSDLPYPGMESFTPFIEEFYNDGITVGCLQSPLMYCPQNYVTRGEMAVFIVRAFGIPLP